MGKMNRVDSYEIHELDDVGAVNLANAICLQAVFDYRKGLKKIMRDGERKVSVAFETARCFIESPAFFNLSGIPSDKAIAAIRESVRNELNPPDDASSKRLTHPYRKRRDNARHATMRNFEKCQGFKNVDDM